MKKIFPLVLGLLLTLLLFPTKGLAETEDQVELWIHTRLEDGTKIEGTDELTFDVYDLTDWREQHGIDEKKDKEFILDTYPTKDELQTFIKKEGLAKCNQMSYPVDTDGNARFAVPRYRKERNAAYLILPTGETGKNHMLPIILYLPELHPDTKKEANELLVYGKYQTLKAKEPFVEESSEPKKQPSTTNDPVVTSGGKLPSMNDQIRNGMMLGLVLISIGFIGFTKNRKKK